MRKRIYSIMPTYCLVAGFVQASAFLASAAILPCVHYGKGVIPIDYMNCRR